MKEKIDVETFIEELQCGDSNTRRRFFAFLKMSKFPQSVKVFFEAESDEDVQKIISLISQELTNAIQDPDYGVREIAVNWLIEHGAPEALSILYQQRIKFPLESDYIDKAIAAIQNRCKFYNYEVWQEAIQNQKWASLANPTAQPSPTDLTAQPSPTDLLYYKLDKIDQTTQQTDKRTEKMASEPKNDLRGAIIHGSVNLGDSPTGNFITTQNNYATDPEVQRAITDLQTLLTQLQTQYPQVKTEAEAIAIIKAEFTEIKQSPTDKQGERILFLKGRLDKGFRDHD
jgi:flagellar hook-basal body complex protein FliE